ncbi:MAG: hypothetical protein HY520_04090 [Candidatus Aenigmarchaeota archaeon]|nr:hypothetical protein [Candidatus Aenigmarchaeota archaeon]
MHTAGSLASGFIVSTLLETDSMRCTAKHIPLKKWPWQYYCGLLDTHKPDEEGRQYTIRLNRTRGERCGKVTLIHELTHILEDLEGIERSNAATESVALAFAERNGDFVDYLWKRYVATAPSTARIRRRHPAAESGERSAGNE